MDLNGLVRFGERRNLVSARGPSHFKRSLPSLIPTLLARTTYKMNEDKEKNNLQELLLKTQSGGKLSTNIYYSRQP
jgi:hypothetical protein